MNGYFKGVTTNQTNEPRQNQNGLKEPPTLRMQTEPINTPRFGVPERNDEPQNAPEPDIAVTSSAMPQPEDQGPDADFSNPGESQTDSIEGNPVNEYIPPFSGKGGIVVQVFLARQAIPLENVKVTISSVEGAPIEVNEILYTDSSGRTQKISLPAPDMHLSMQAQEDIQPYAVYDITAELDGYQIEPKMCSDGRMNALVFDGICSIQNIEMIPVEESGV